MSFDPLPNLSHATPCVQVNPAEVDLQDLEYSPPGASGAFSMSRNQPADTLIVSAGPFARAGALFRQAGADPRRAVLTVGGGSDEIVLTVQDFLDVADACRK